MGCTPHIPDRLAAERCVLVVVDIQEKFRDLIHGMDRVVANTERLIRFCDHLQIPVVVTEHYPRGLGVTISEVRNLIDPFAPVEKIDFSCTGSDEFQKKLRELNRDQILLCGIETHVCIYQTARDLLLEGRQVAVAADAVSSGSTGNREIGLQAMGQLGVQMMGTQMMMFEILRKAGTARFKQVAALLRD